MGGGEPARWVGARVGRAAVALAQAAPAAVSAAAWRVGGGVEPVWATVARAAAVPNQGRRPRRYVGQVWQRQGRWR